MWKSTSDSGYLREPPRHRADAVTGKHRVDGVGRQKFDSQTGAYVDATAGFVAQNGGKGCRYDQDVEALARAAGLRVVRSERFGGGFFGSFELAPAAAPR